MRKNTLAIAAVMAAAALATSAFSAAPRAYAATGGFRRGRWPGMRNRAGTKLAKLAAKGLIGKCRIR